MNCLIIDDEPLAQEVIEHYIQKAGFLHLQGKCSNALQAFAALSKAAPDLIFLDIHMPEIDGLSFIRTLKSPPKIILTTAYPQYALEGYELDVVDYLLKPVSFERFLKAVNKAREQLTVTPAEPATTPQAATGDLFIKSDGKYLRVNCPDILYVEGLRNYLLVHTKEKKIIAHSTMKNIEDELSSYPSFVRIHKSYLVNTSYITEIEGNMVKLGQTELPVGSVYKNELLKLIRIL